MFKYNIIIWSLILQGCGGKPSSIFMPDGGNDLSSLSILDDMGNSYSDLLLFTTPDLIRFADLRPIAIDLGGSITGSVSNISGTVDLSANGTLDWIHWGYTWGYTLDGLTNRKINANIINNITVIGPEDLHQYRTSAVNYVWNDGSPTQTSVGTNNGTFVQGVNNGFLISAPAGKVSKILSIYLGGYDNDFSLTAHLTDNSGDFNDIVSNNMDGSIYKVYTFIYKSVNDNANLEIRWVSIKDYFGASNVTIEAATLSQ